MSTRTNATKTLRWLLAGLCLCASSRTTYAQVNPAEITNPQLKAAETTYYPQIMALYRAINGMKPPFSFRLSRYVGLDPSQQIEADSRGIEFVYFQNRLLLKITGNYNAAYSAERLTQNQRASRTFSDVIAPMLTLAAKQIPEDVACDGIGFEIAYHARTATQNVDYEGKEILVVVFDRADGFAFVGAGNDSERQQILNRSRIYVDGKEFGLALGQAAPFDLETIGRTVGSQTDGTPAAPRTPADSRGNSTLVNPRLFPPRGGSELGNTQPRIPATLPGQPASATIPTTPAVTAASHSTPATAADAEHLQSQFQSQLDALATLGQAKFHFVDYAPPSFVLYRDQVVLQITLRNTMHFTLDSTSIYKRAAQSFDLFLALQLKDLVDKVPADASFDGFDITVLNQLGSDPRASSEAVEFICPRGALHQFVDADITNQQLIDESIVLVNGVRVGLNLQLVE